MKLTIIGTGYVGLVSGVCFAQLGHEVICVDRDAAKITALQAGKMPIVEPDLAHMVAVNVAANRLDFSTDLTAACASADAIFIAVGTPPGDADGMPDLAALNAALTQLANCVTSTQLIVIKSTVPVGTTRRIAGLLPDNPIANNPEFLREGSAIDDFMHPDRIVAGVTNDAARATIEAIYAPQTSAGRTLFVTTPESSEMIKYAANSLLAARVAYINEIADICEKVGANIREVAKGVGMDARIGSSFLRPGPGIGGSCFPKDTLALTAAAKQVGAPVTIIEAVVKSNDLRKIRMAEKIIDAMGGEVAGKVIAVLGLTFKPGTDDMRESPSLDIIPILQQSGATIHAYDPEGMEQARPLLPDVTLCNNAMEAIKGADACVILTEWAEFSALNLAKVKSALAQPIIIDLRNIFTRKAMLDAGFTYHSVGREAIGQGATAPQDLAISG